MRIIIIIIIIIIIKIDAMTIPPFHKGIFFLLLRANRDKI